VKRNLFILSALFILFGLHAANEYSGMTAGRHNAANPATLAPIEDMVATFAESTSTYCVKNSSRSSSRRSLKSCTIKGATVKGVEQTFSSTLFTELVQNNVYVDRVSETLNASLGDELTIFLESIGVYEGLHFYVFIDYNQNFTFEVEELVSYNHFNGFNSKGEVVSGADLPFSNDDPDKHLPEFTIPATASLGETRMRIVSQNNSIDPCGNIMISFNDGTMLDYTINIHPNAYPVTFTQPATGGSFTVEQGGAEIQTGDFVFSGDSLEISILPEADYQLKRLTINEENYLESIENNFIKYEVTGNTDIEVEFDRGSAIAAFRENETIVYLNTKGDLVIEGAPVGSIAQIYNLMGQPIRAVSILSDKEIVSGDYLSQTIYIIKLNYKNNTSVHKIIIK
jgi:hypothetical protein